MRIAATSRQAPAVLRPTTTSPGGRTPEHRDRAPWRGGPGDEAPRGGASRRSACTKSLGGRTAHQLSAHDHNFGAARRLPRGAQANWRRRAPEWAAGQASPPPSGTWRDTRQNNEVQAPTVKERGPCARSSSELRAHRTRAATLARCTARADSSGSRCTVAAGGYAQAKFPWAIDQVEYTHSLES